MKDTLVTAYIDDQRTMFLYNGRNLYEDLLRYLGRDDPDLKLYHTTEFPHPIVVDDRLDKPLEMRITRFSGRDVTMTAHCNFSHQTYFPFQFQSSVIWLNQWCRPKEIGEPEIIWPHTARFATDEDALLFYMSHKRAL